jgi:DNA (cytosine-5)-methyltransferase 1
MVKASRRAVPSRIQSTSRHHQPRDLTEAQREVFRRSAQESRLAKQAAQRGDGPAPVHEVNVPRLNPDDLMPTRPSQGLGALSLFSGGGGLDLGFERAGYDHVASLEILENAAATLVKARPDWDVRGGAAGDVRNMTDASWRKFRADTDVVHGGPPCQPFSIAGRQQGHLDERDMWPEFVRCVLAVRPRAFVAENVPAIADKKFEGYVQENILAPLQHRYTVQKFILKATEFGIPQIRRRVFFVGFARKQDARQFNIPAATHEWRENGQIPGMLPPCMGVREALGLSDIGFDAPSPTIRSTLTGPRHTTSILNSTAAQRTFASLQVWPNGVAADRQSARRFIAKNGHFRLSVADVGILQGFPEWWRFEGATYMQLGQIGNAVAPPMGFAVATAVSDALS